MKRIYLALFVKFVTITLFGQTDTNQSISIPSIPLITTYLPEDYQAGIQNWDITQDTTGYFYFANNYGLLEFDGASWTNHTIEGATKIRSVVVDHETNKIYVGGQRLLGYFEHTKIGLEYHSLVSLIPESISFDVVWDLVYFNQEVYANINGSIAKIEEDQITKISNVSDALFIAENSTEIIVGSTENVLLKKEDQPFNSLLNLGANNYRGIVQHKEGYLLFSYDGEILKYSNNKLTKLTTGIDEFLTHSKINRVLKLENGDIVIATQNDGLVILDSDLNSKNHLTKNKGLNHRTVISLYEDNFNNLWVGLNNGICVIELGSQFSLINENTGLHGTGYAAVMHNNEIHLGTSSGLFIPNKKATVNTKNSYELVQGTDGLVNNISVIDDEIILSHHEGAFSYSQKGINQFFNESGSWKFHRFNDNKVLGGTYNGFYLFDKSNKTQFNALDGLSESSRIFEFENDSILWMTHGYKGVYKILLSEDNIKRVDHYGEGDGFPSDILISVYQLADELIFTAAKGVYKFDSDSNRFIPHPFLNTWFQDQHVSKIKIANENTIFFIANGEIGVLERKSIGIFELKEKQFKKINRYISDDLENINVINDQDVLIGAKEGFILYEPEPNENISEQFNIHLKNVAITTYNDSTSNVSGVFFESSVTEKTKRIHFEYSAPFYDGVGEIDYSYRLLPYENEWSNWSKTNWKEYTNLPAKEYTFQIKARNIYENESEVNSYQFRIKPRWYESNIAIAGYIGVIPLFLSIVLFIREQKHRNEKLIISKTKEEEIRSKEREISEFSEKTNQEIEALKNENLQKEIDHKNSQLASVTIHLLSKNELVMSIRKKLNDAIDEKDNTESLQKILKTIDNNMDEEEAWSTFQYHFDKVHGNFLHKLKSEVSLTPQETKLCAYLKMNMSTKDIAHLMNITVRGVELARYRLRKKLGISRDINLTTYLNNFN